MELGGSAARVGRELGEVSHLEVAYLVREAIRLMREAISMHSEKHSDALREILGDWPSRVCHALG